MARRRENRKIETTKTRMRLCIEYISDLRDAVDGSRKPERDSEKENVEKTR